MHQVAKSDDALSQALTELSSTFDGELRFDSVSRTLYSTDASVYQEVPQGVAIPKSEQDIRQLILLARRLGTSLIPRTAGTSLAGQVVGNGIIVDVSKYFTKILEVNAEERWVRVQPGVIRNELNSALAEYGMLFGPETSSQNRAMVGGMVGNNSCGSNSVVYGSTRDHVLEIHGFFSDGTPGHFTELSVDEFSKKCEGDTFEASVYRNVRELLSDKDVRDEVTREFPKPEIPRRNTGYAIDMLMDAKPFDESSDRPFNFCKLLAGSEGTLFFTTELKLNCVPLPPAVSGVLCVNFDTIDASLRATQVAVKYGPYACELIDRFVLQGAARNIEQRDNMSFVEGDPATILIIALRADSEQELQRQADELTVELKRNGLGYHLPLLTGDEERKAWDLRKAGLGILNTVPGDEKPQCVIEDTAVAVSDLPEYIREFNENLKTKYGKECVHYAHAGTGELHLRPILSLKSQEGRELFRSIAADTADLVKKYRGSLSGEHGDGRLRGEFLRRMIGGKNYEVVRRIKEIWDPKQVFNPNKIVDTPPMNEGLRFAPGGKTHDYETLFDFATEQGIVRATEMCSGSGDCRKTEITGGTMCPSYMATRDERETTRARANMLRHSLSNPADLTKPFTSHEVKDVLDLCLSCKGCKRECPSNVDLAKLKAEFMQGYYDEHGIPRRANLIANFASNSKLASRVPWLFNLIVGMEPFASLFKWFAGFAPERSLPRLHATTLRRWFERHSPHANAGKLGRVLLFCDEFTDYNDTPIGIAAVELLERLGFAVEIPKHVESGRAALSKGLVRRARDLAEENVRLLTGEVSEATPLIGIEPSAILSFRDEYPSLVRTPLREAANELACHSLLVDEFLAQKVAEGMISPESFSDEVKEVRLHGHCHQKALSRLKPTVDILGLPKNYTVKPMIDGEGFYKTGCCGMAGSFGYEKEHYSISKQIAELLLMPAIRKLDSNVLIAAPGTSCRHQIRDFANRRALHPVEILRNALRRDPS